jgi:hypothetical protein
LHEVAGLGSERDFDFVSFVVADHGDDRSAGVVGDGNLSPDELLAALFDRLDADKNGFVTEEELKALWRTKP